MSGQTVTGRGHSGRIAGASSRGRVLKPAAGVLHTGLAIKAGGAGAIVLLMFGLVMFGGLFQYVIDARPLYLLAKVWPVLMAPLTLATAIKVRPGYQPLVLMACAWMLAATPFISVGQLGNDAVGAIASTSKIWPLTGALGAAAALAWLKPSPERLMRAVALLAAATFLFLIGAWFLAPDALFQQTIETTKVFLSDPERGRRIYAPMMFAILGLFALNRSFWHRPAVWKAAGVAVGLVLMLVIYKQRAQIAGTGLVLLLGAVLSWGRFREPALAVLAAGALAAIVPVAIWLQSGAAMQGLGGSLSIRQIEAAAALDFLNAAPWRWVTGVGSATRIGGVTLGNIVGTPFFFPSDLGWLGVVFEYGVIGATLMLMLHLAAIRIGWTAAAGGSLVGAAVFDYALFLLIVSPVVSVVLSPGELATCLALSWWLARRAKA